MGHLATGPAVANPIEVAANASPQRWQDAYLDLEQEKRKVENQLREKNEESSSLAREVQQLRDQIREEQDKRKDKISEFQRQLETVERENKQLHMKVMKVQMVDSAKLSDVTTVKKEVVAKTMELEKMMREFQATSQDKLFSRVSNVTNAMLAVCQKPETALQIHTPIATEESIAPAVAMGSASNGMMALQDDAPSGTFLDADTQQALKRRLQALGDVVVFASDNFEACCASGRVIPPGALRVRPRRCDHVFLVESLMPYWAEGLCPVCRCSFAYDRPRDQGYDESDKYSSVSTSVSQQIQHSLAVSRPGMPPLPGSSNSDGGSLRSGPRSLRSGGGLRSSSSMQLLGDRGARSSSTLGEARGRSASLSRANRRRRSASALDARSDVSGDRRGGSSMGGRDRQSPSPPRSVLSVQSHGSPLRSVSPHGASYAAQGVRPL